MKLLSRRSIGSVAALLPLLTQLPAEANAAFGDDVRGEARVSPALVRGHVILPSMHAYFLLLCAFVLVVGLLSALFFSLNRLAAIEDRLLDAVLGGVPGDRPDRVALNVNERVELEQLLWSLLLR